MGLALETCGVFWWQKMSPLGAGVFGPSWFGDREQRSPQVGAGLWLMSKSAFSWLKFPDKSISLEPLPPSSLPFPAVQCRQVLPRGAENYFFVLNLSLKMSEFRFWREESGC